MNIQIPRNLTNPARILFVMAKQNGKLSNDDAVRLVNCGVLKDKKAFSNAMYILTRNGYVVKGAAVNAWFITQSGVVYLDSNVVKCQLKCSDENLNDKRDLLRDENTALKQQIEVLKCQIVELQNACQTWMAAARSKEAEIGMLNKKINELNAKLSSSSNGINPSYDDIINAGTKVINSILANLIK